MQKSNSSGKYFSLKKYEKDLEHYEKSLKGSRMTHSHSISEINQKGTENNKYLTQQKQRIIHQQLASNYGVKKFVKANTYSKISRTKDRMFNDRTNFKFLNEKFMDRKSSKIQNSSQILINQKESDNYLKLDKPKQNGCFNKNDQELFKQECCKLYQLTSSNNMIESQLVDKINKEIQLRDSIYNIVSQEFQCLDGLQLIVKLKDFFKKHQIMKKVIAQFQNMSKTEHITNFEELYYMLKAENNNQ